ncbi:MAG: YceD family protein [Chloroflexota bacterium]
MIAIHVAQFLKEEPGSRREFALREIGPQLGDVTLEAPLVGTAELVRTQRGILVTMPYRTTVTLVCGRCLNEFGFAVEDRFQDEVLAPRGELYERDSQRDDDALRIGQDYVLDIGEILRQELVIQTPLQPLCRLDCPGLCETCGADLRSEKCACDQIGANNPFGALRALLIDNPARPPDNRQ